MTFLQPPSQRTLPLRLLFAVLGLLIAATAIYAVVGGDSPTVDVVMRDWVTSLAYVLAAGIVALRAVRVSDRRGPWILIAVGLSLYAAGNLLWSLWLENLPSPPIPSLSDGLWLSLYPASYAGLVWLSRGRTKGASAGVWLDGVVAALGVAAVGAAVVVGPVLASASGSAVAVATNLAYPVADLLLAGLVLGLLALRNWRPDPMWRMLGSGFLLLCVADIIYLLHVAAGNPDTSAVANVFYLIGVAFLALAAWQPEREAPAPRLQGWSMLLVPGFFALTAVGLTFADHFFRLPFAADGLAALTLLAALLRTALTFRDVRALAETRRQATTDDLTSLPNRRLFLSRTQESIAAARVTGDRVALLIVDLDHFKELNDTLGHRAGDLLLQQIGERLSPVLRPSDTLARLGGDEFGIVLPGAWDEAAALWVADKVRDRMRAPFEVEGIRLSVGASVGIALFPAHGDNAEVLLQRADIAMYQAKADHSGREVYAAERDRHSRDNLELAGELPVALATGQLVVHFQPKAEADTHRITGAEALVRWNHPTRGLLSPDTFVGLAEQAGLARELTRVVMVQALDRCRAWRAAGHDLQVAVNATIADLLDVDFPIEVAAALGAHDLPADALMIEVTESSVMTDPGRVGDVLGRLRELGVGVSLDDFGTGYSSLTHLRTLPVCEVKLDRSFVSRMSSDPADAAIISSTIDLAHNLGMNVVAEGVEDDETWEHLAQLGCELIQGYRLSRPLPAGELGAFLEQATALAAH